MKRQRVKFPWDLYWENKTYKPDAYKLVITKGYGVQATTIEGQNAFPPVLCVSFTWQMVKTRVSKLRVIEGPNRRGLLLSPVIIGDI